MSLKINVSFTENYEKEIILFLMKPVMKMVTKQKETSKGPYKHLYFTFKDIRGIHKKADL